MIGGSLAIMQGGVMRDQARPASACCNRASPPARHRRPAACACWIRPIPSRVEFEPAPAMTGTRPVDDADHLFDDLRCSRHGSASGFRRWCRRGPAHGCLRRYAIRQAFPAREIQLPVRGEGRDQRGQRAFEHDGYPVLPGHRGLHPNRDCQDVSCTRRQSLAERPMTSSFRDKLLGLLLAGCWPFCAGPALAGMRRRSPGAGRGGRCATGPRPRRGGDVRGRWRWIWWQWQRLRAGQGTWPNIAIFRRHGDWRGMALLYKRGDAVLRADLPPRRGDRLVRTRRPTR